MKKILYTLISGTTRNVLLEKHMDIVHRTLFMEPLTIAYAAKAYDSDKLIDTKQKLTEHWNEAHIAITKRLRSVAEGHKQS